MKKENHKPLPDSAFVVLALIAEGETHGYNIQKTVHTRGFQFWTDLKRSSAYNALILLEEAELIESEQLPGGGPDKKVYRITDTGKQRLIDEGFRHLSAPNSPKSEIDLGIYVLPFLPKKIAKEGLIQCLAHLEQRLEFLEERLGWCNDHKLYMPALAFERPLLLLKAEIDWLRKVKRHYESDTKLKVGDWQKYEFRQPPHHVKGDEHATPSTK